MTDKNTPNYGWPQDDRDLEAREARKIELYAQPAPATSDEREALNADRITEIACFHQCAALHAEVVFTKRGLVSFARAIEQASAAHPSQPLDMVSSGGEALSEAQIVAAAKASGLGEFIGYDRAELGAELRRFARAIEQGSAAHRREDQRDEVPVGFINERTLSILTDGSVICTHISPTKTEFQQIGLFAKKS